MLKYYMEVYLFKCNIFVVTRANNTGRHKKGFKYGCLHHNDLWYRAKWSNWMLEKIQILSHVPYYLTFIRQNGFLRSILQSSGEKSPNVFIGLGNTDIYTTDICNQVQIELSHWKAPIEECINEITVIKAMFRNNQRVRSL